ncbi:hypothetical protein mflW37_0290 [Mesoplasma florum W37]|uniref:P80 family lipoprotein n=1 Tax=Mesoplasma florum TaxID=2151 RepID=A0AAD2JE21_MESFO|nr:lipoprotein [Mesoplasma florum]AGY41096.1 hypothetical protein mflW37_0290 [Mesoplasma florum W37]AVN59328.1 hypothetical protein CG008_00140 [Mesoplasma florum]AVN65434.1 hypothetical protein MflW12_0290 [Mesoplasma florum]
MKKLLSVLSATALTATAASSVVACGGNKPEKNVVFVLPQETIGQSSLDKQLAYKDLVNDFNSANAEKIKSGEMVKIEARWEKSGNIAKNIAAKGNLPDLYVFYPDAVSTFAYSGAGSQVRDMKESYGTEAEFEEFTNSLITDSYIKEGQYEKIKGKPTQLVLPFGKSVDLSVINVRTLVDLIEVLGLDESSSVRTNFNQYNATKRGTLLGSYSKLSEYSSLDKTKALNDYKNIDPETKTKFENLMQTVIDSNSENIDSAIRGLFKTQEDVLTITKVMSTIYQDSIKYTGVTSQGNDQDIQKTITNTENKSHYAFSIDSIENKFFMDHAAVTGNENIDITSNNNGFMYNSQINYNESKGKVSNTDVEFNTQSESYQTTTNLLQGFKDIAKDIAKANGSELKGNQADIEKAWNGTFMTKYSGTSGSVYTSTSFVNGTTLVGSGSSAGAYNYVGGPKYTPSGSTSSKTLRLTQNSDILTTSTIGNEKDAFMSQGPGLAGFKSTGENAAEKETTVTAFLQYIMQPVQSAQFALKTNYMPATKSSMEIYKNYIDGTYNNTDAFNFKNNKRDILKLIENNSDITKGISKDDLTAAHYLDGSTITVKRDENNNIIQASFKKLEGENPNKDRIESLNAVFDKLNNKTEKEDNQWRFEKLFEPLADYSSSDKANTRAVTSAVNAGYVNDFLTPLLSDSNEGSQTLLVTSTPSPIGDTFRNGIKSAIVEAKNNTIMYNWDIDFDKLLSESATDPSSLKTYILAKNGDDVLKSVKVSFKQ